MTFLFCLNWLHPEVIYFHMSNFWRKLPKNSSDHDNQVMGIYGQNSSTNILNGYNSEQNGKFSVFLLNSSQQVGIRAFFTLNYL